VLDGPNAAVELAVSAGADPVLNAIVGAEGLRSSIATIQSGSDLALANKESLVVGGEIVMPLAQHHGVEIMPVDSEHTALHQLISGAGATDVRRLTITASGGPFRGMAPEEFVDASVDDALAHPVWSMGGKITIDSATLMNKGLRSSKPTTCSGPV
jgi:1-deoxy-D-xylulose-5-phosphate reductoisomerase